MEGQLGTVEIIITIIGGCAAIIGGLFRFYIINKRDRDARFRDLEERHNRQRAEDIARQEAQRKEDRERQEVQRKEDRERQEAQREADLKRQEVQRNADLAQRKEDLERQEAQRNADAERHRAELAAHVALIKAELDPIKEQVYNHLPTQIRAVEEEIKELRSSVEDDIKELRNIITQYVIEKSMAEMEDEHDEGA